MISINSDEERVLVHNLVKQNKNTGVWLSALRVELGKPNFMWSDGSEINYTYWEHEKPIHYFEDKILCVSFSRSTGYWHDVDCNRRFRQMCQKYSDDFILREIRRRKNKLEHEIESKCGNVDHILDVKEVVEYLKVIYVDSESRLIHRETILTNLERKVEELLHTKVLFFLYSSNNSMN
ncbi:lymphocyte antigen 75-like protein [Leptotrombidium deliense]|uniref:Lymphocyte antigen 75-like protein n=1 Tax=Leptotrombidium deliense TaxID=299467 RepID=A0A443SB97_9ACAR|nr:lymphocyte antigen 75-like protein [Leptotrombidium deliense]